VPGPIRAHVFVGDLDDPVLDGDDRHHLERVLRLRDGDEVSVSDGRGGVRRCRFGRVLEPLEDVVRVGRPEPRITVAFALTKADRPEWTVQKLTEAGVDAIVPFVAARSVVRWDGDKAIRAADRWAKVAREAAMQSRRVWLPEVAPVATFAEAVALDGAALADMDGERPTLRTPTLLVGPEGGWAEEERAAAPTRVVLGTHVFRAETAAVAAGVLLNALRAGLVA
jgi:16S rRNA (uracil1498-N3)-methyltransferase